MGQTMSVTLMPGDLEKLADKFGPRVPDVAEPRALGGRVMTMATAGSWETRGPGLEAAYRMAKEYADAYAGMVKSFCEDTGLDAAAVRRCVKARVDGKAGEEIKRAQLTLDLLLTA